MGKSLITLPIRIWIKWYLRKPRPFTYEGIEIIVHPGVFHPGFFHSTKFILKFLKDIDLQGKTFLELGSGSGIISVYAAKKQAIVTAVDISDKAIENTYLNKKKNNATIQVIKSDLFDQVSSSTFDWIVINPPYYPSDPTSDEDHAWYCGRNHDYFQKLFQQLGSFIHKKSKVLMVLSEVCDLTQIFKIAAIQSFELTKISEKKVWVDDRNYLFYVESKI